MQRLPVDSSDIVSVGYDAASGMLEIEFHGGRLYAYRNVEPAIYEQLMRADSHGQYFNTFIHGKYRFERQDSARQAQPTRGLAFVGDDTFAYACLELALQPYGIEAEKIILPFDILRSDNPELVAAKIAKAAYRLSGRPVVVACDAWSVLSLHGFPGTAMRSIAKQLGSEDYLRLLAGKSDRTISISEVLVYYDGKRTKSCSQTVFGKVGSDASGEGYQSLDRLVTLVGRTKTLAATYDSVDTTVAMREESIWQNFAKWYNLQRRIGRA